MFCLAFPENGFNFATQTLVKKEKYHFQTPLRTLDLKIKVASTPFSKMLLMINFGFNKHDNFASLYQEIVSTLSLKNLQNSENYHIQTLRTFAFDLKVDLQPYSKTLPMTNFGFK